MSLKRIGLMLIVALAGTAFLFSDASRAGGVGGTQRYTPTAIEWLQLYCNSLARERAGYYSTCLSDDKNSLTVQIGYWDKSLKKEAEDEFIPISYLVKKYADRKGWSWLTMSKKVEFIKQEGGR